MNLPSINKISLKKGKKTDRRVFLKTLGRLGIGAGIGLLGFSLLKKATLIPAQNSCTGNSICRSCRAVSECKLPEAVSYKQAGKKG